MSDTDSSNYEFLDDEGFDDNLFDFENTASSLEVDIDCYGVYERKASGTKTIEYISDKIRYMNIVANYYKRYIHCSIGPVLTTVQQNIVNTGKTLAESIDGDDD